MNRKFTSITSVNINRNLHAIIFVRYKSESAPKKKNGCHPLLFVVVKCWWALAAYDDDEYPPETSDGHHSAPLSSHHNIVTRTNTKWQQNKKKLKSFYCKWARELTFWFNYATKQQHNWVNCAHVRRELFAFWIST